MVCWGVEVKWVSVSCWCMMLVLVLRLRLRLKKKGERGKVVRINAKDI